eukprot:CAMPEP_0176218694 /NCGR_PEP_ID=MMETSP0121_2-20121125/18329_1 /TAXON_ID=160619 /ORGANISM="Kryptoperidinium foliaceum, Strain CCMP 1326" /LENGTH=170 /DNA_ID=CAMNT_0017557841 /DNA_START=18 /DNA_END=527 /DNA_ORIENTATION=+
MCSAPVEQPSGETMEARPCTSAAGSTSPRHATPAACAKQSVAWGRGPTLSDRKCRGTAAAEVARAHLAAFWRAARTQRRGGRVGDAQRDRETQRYGHTKSAGECATARPGAQHPGATARGAAAAKGFEAPGQWAAGASSQPRSWQAKGSISRGAVPQAHGLNAKPSADDD